MINKFLEALRDSAKVSVTDVEFSAVVTVTLETAKVFISHNRATSLFMDQFSIQYKINKLQAEYLNETPIEPVLLDETILASQILCRFARDAV